MEAILSAIEVDNAVAKIRIERVKKVQKLISLHPSNFMLTQQELFKLGIQAKLEP